TAAQFIARLGETKDGRPVVRNMVIHPVRDGQNYVTFDAPAPDVVKPFGFYADAGILDQVKLRAARDPRIMFIYPWRESTAYILISRGGGGLFIATLWGLLLWTIDGRPVRGATIAKIRRELSELREARRPQAELTEQVDRFNESIESALTDAPGLAGALEM